MTTESKSGKINSSMIIGALGLIGVSVAGISLASKNAEVSNETNQQAQTESVINLPATNEKVNGLENRLESSVKGLNDQINRREVEMRNERDQLLNEIHRVKDMDRDRIIRLEELLTEHLSNCKH